MVNYSLRSRYSPTSGVTPKWARLAASISAERAGSSTARATSRAPTSVHIVTIASARALVCKAGKNVPETRSISERIWDKAGRIDALVNNAGSSILGAVEETSIDQARSLLETNVLAAQRHWLAERLLDRTEMNTTHIRPTFFAQWLPHQWSAGRAGWTRRDGGAVLRLPFGDGRHAPIRRRRSGPFRGGGLGQSGTAQRAKLSALRSGRPKPLPNCGQAVRGTGYLGALRADRDLSFRPGLVRPGLSTVLIQHLSAVAQDYQDGIFAGANNLIEVATGTPAMTVDEFAIANKAVFERAHHPVDKRVMR
jgi:NAD(P)H dehydrogenase (quinone)